MIKLKDVKVDDFYISLVKLIGKNIKDVSCYLSKEFGEDVTVCAFQIVFEDDTMLQFEGEHDIAYLTEYRTQKQPNFDDETLNNLYTEQNGDDDEY